LKQILIGIIQKFPKHIDGLPIERVYARLEAGVSIHGRTLGRKKHREMISRACKEAGWRSTGERYAKWFYGK